MKVDKQIFAGLFFCLLVSVFGSIGCSPAEVAFWTSDPGSQEENIAYDTTCVEYVKNHYDAIMNSVPVQDRMEGSKLYYDEARHKNVYLRPDGKWFYHAPSWASLMDLDGGWRQGE